MPKTSFRPIHQMLFFAVGVAGVPLIAAPMAAGRFLFQLGKIVEVIAPVAKHKLRFDDRRSVSVLRDGRTVFLNKETGTVDVFSATFAYEYSINPRSEGRRIIPSKAIAVTTSGVLAALELTGQAVSLYRLNKTGSSLLRTIELTGQPTAICALDNRFLIHINESNRTIYSLSDDGNLRKVFELGMVRDAPRLASHYFNAELTCLREQNVFLAYSRSFPMISAYSAVDGKQLWVTNLAQFTALPLRERSDGGLEIPVDKTSYDEIVSVFPLGQNVLGVQFRSIHDVGDAENQANQPHTRFLGSSSGTQIGKSDSLPLFATATKNRVYSYDSQSGNLFGYKYETTR